MTERDSFDIWWGSAYISHCHEEDSAWDAWQARAALAEQGEPVAWMWTHDETGRIGFVDQWQLDNGWQEANPRLHVTTPLYTAPQAPLMLSDEQIEAICEAFDVDLEAWKPFARAVLAAAQAK
jgi:hypothetical protein